MRRLQVNREVRKLWTLQHRRRRREFAANVTIGSVTVWAGDYALQELYEEGDSFNTRRSGAFMLWGALMGAWGHVWYNSMAAIPYMVAYPLRQVALYQTVFLPLEYVGFYTLIGAVEGESAVEIRAELSDKFGLTLLSDWIVYTPALICIIKYLPVHMRAAADCGFTFVWCVFLSFLKHNVDELPWTQHNKVEEASWSSGVVQREQKSPAAAELVTSCLCGARERCVDMIEKLKQKCFVMRTLCAMTSSRHEEKNVCSSSSSCSSCSSSSSSSSLDCRKGVGVDDFLATNRCCDDTEHLQFGLGEKLLASMPPRIL